MLDPDAPDPALPVFADYRHFVGGDFFGVSTNGGIQSLTNSTPACRNMMLQIL